MSQHTARHDPRATSGDDDHGRLQVRQAEREQPGRLADQPAGQGGPGLGGPGLGEPDEGEFELTGDDDLSAADLGPAAPGFTDPDAPSGRVRK